MTAKRIFQVAVLIFLSLPLFSQVREITGTVLNEERLPMIGVTVVVEGTSVGTVTDLNGNYSIQASGQDRLKFSFVGSQEVFKAVSENTVINVTLMETVTSLDEVVVMGYGQIKKASVVGSISQVKGDELLKAGGVTNLSNAITGMLPGVVTIQNSGEPGNDAATIFIRGQTTWNNAQPLILVDGVERELNDIDPREVESISVLKDASATAVFGVKGANGVILVTSKRGKEGKPELNISANTTVKTVSRIPVLLGSYDALRLKNDAIEREINVNESSWGWYMPQEVLEQFRLQEDPELFPDVAWHEHMVEDYALSHNINMNVSGGTDFVKYFSSLSYLTEGDILGTKDYGQGYDPNYSYDKYNFRSNLDFKLTKTTSLSIDVSGYYSSKREPAGGSNAYWKGVYSQPPDLFPVQYSDGFFGQTSRWDRYDNPVAALNLGGYNTENMTQLLSDFKFNQKLDFITKGLSVNAKFSYDNLYRTNGVNVEDEGTVYKYIVPELMLSAQNAEDSISAVEYDFPATYGVEIHQFNFVDKPFVSTAESASSNITRNLFYQFSLNYRRAFGLHDISALALLNRDQRTSGTDFPSYREDWVGRVTYNYDERYFFEANAAYNGSEKFGPKYRFGFFPSLAVGWIVSNEKFFEAISETVNKLKFRYSDGKVGSDRGIPRWGYVGGWELTNSRMSFGYPNLQPSYDMYREDIIANPEIHWEVARKRDIGMETSFLDYMLSFDLDFFWENRDDIFMSGEQRTIPPWFGAAPVAANLGSTKSHGWEVEMRFKRQASSSGLRYWFNGSYGFVVDEVIYREDPELMLDYQKDAGYQIGQTTTQLTAGFMHTWDDIYTSTLGESNTFRIPGDYSIVDFNSDGVTNSYDNVPYAFPSRPQYNYNLSAGIEFKGFSASVQFYGVRNVSRNISLSAFSGGMSVARPFHMEEGWTPETWETATYPVLRYDMGSPSGYYNIKNASYLRLKNAELAYNLNAKFLSRIAVSRLRIFINGNNLFIWSKMLEDREGGSYDEHNYPMLKRYNFGVNITF
ncbi:MAG: TonB-dependent receptor [Bacteroidales bacterium]|nr:TonB-dependent receptor [Bacteroidales bacterium]MCF8389187.1 TonB-dependent receptor [Bacteroidales bacterium]